jgi:uncharacterized protein YbjT (DUF2867 family)
MTGWKLLGASADNGVGDHTLALSHREPLRRPRHMKIAIVGGTGTVGVEAARELTARGHDVRVLCRHAPEYPVDLTAGSGLERALEGVEVVVDAAQGRRDVLVEGARRLLAAELAAGVHHHIGVSIVGVDRVGGRYYKVKLAQEAEIARSGVPWTIVRATQFHQLLAGWFAAGARLGVLPALRVPLQPVDPIEVGRVLADTAEAEPSRSITQFAGPEVRSMRELAHCWRESTGSRALGVHVPMPRSLRAGGLTNPAAWRGTVTFDRWLAS